MANIYVNSVTGNNSNDGLTWATAKANLTGAVSAMAASDTIYVAPTHRESSPSQIALTVLGTVNNPAKIICAATDANPPTSTSVEGRFTSTNASSLLVNGNAYVYGMDFYLGTGTSAISNIQMNNAAGSAVQTYDTCKFIYGATVDGTAVLASSSTATTGQTVVLKNCGFNFKTTGQRLSVSSKFVVEGGQILAGSLTPTSVGMFNLSGRGGSIEVSSFDFSQAASGLQLASMTGCGTISFVNCRLPVGWTGGLVNGTLTTPGQRFKMINCDSADTNYRMMVVDYAGTITTETVVTRFNGASDGVTPISWKMVSTANTVFPTTVLQSEEILRWFPMTDGGETLGNSTTFSVEIISDGASNLRDDEVWVEAQVFSTNGAPLGTYVSDRKTNLLATGVNQTVSSELWSAGSLAAPKRQTLSVTATPREAGFVSLKVCLAKPSTTVYVCPKVRVV